MAGALRPSRVHGDGIGRTRHRRQELRLHCGSECIWADGISPERRPQMRPLTTGEVACHRPCARRRGLQPPPPQRRLQGRLQRTQPQLQALDLVPELVAENSKNVSSQDVELKRGAGWSGKEDVCACCAVGWC